MSNIPVLELGFGEEPQKYDSTAVAEQADKPNDSSLSIGNLSPDEQKAVRDFMEKINIADSNVVLNYGAAAQTKIANFSDNVLQTVRTNDTGEVGKSLTNLVVEIKGFDVSGEEKGGFLSGLFSGAKNITKQIEKTKAGYDKVEANIDKIVSSLEGHQRVLLKDVSMLDSMYKTNLDYFKELSMYIIAGDEKLKEYIANDIPAQKAKAESSGDEMEVQKLNDMVALANRFEKKLHDLKLSRIISIQMAPQVRMIQNNNVALVEKIQSSIVNAIPLWKNQMVIALGMANSKAALSAQKKVTDMTNELLIKNSEMLRQGSVEIAKESERSIISVETVRKTNENLIATINEVLDIQQKGGEQRAAAEAELQKIEVDLKKALLDASRKNIK